MSMSELLLAGKEGVAFRIKNDFRTDSQYADIILEVVYIDEEDSGQPIGLYGNYQGEKNQYKGLRFVAQMDNARSEPCHWVSYIKEFMWESISLEEAKKVVAVLNPIHKKLQHIESKEGYSETFEEYIVRIGRILKIKGYFITTEHNQTKLCRDVGGLRDYLRTIVNDNLKRWGLESQDAVA